MSHVPFEKEKYLQIMNTEGAQKALTQLHHDLIRWEVESFEGRKGYQPEMWQELEPIRAFARELWNIANEKNP